jgi:hypothetical protein
VWLPICLPAVGVASANRGQYLVAVVRRPWGINNAVVPYAELTAAQWLDRSDEEAARIAQDIADRYEMRLVALRWYRYAGRAHRVALFDRAGVVFALVPGGRLVLGYDCGRFRPTPAQAASFAESAEEWGLPALAEFLDGVTSPVRRVELSAMLVAVEAMEPCASDLDRMIPACASWWRRRVAAAATGS